MREQIMSRKRFWIARFREKETGYIDYITDVGHEGRRSWWHTPEIEEAERFKTRGDANKALRSPIWAREKFDKKHGYATEVVQIDETVKLTWVEAQVISDENALVQLAHLGEGINEQDDHGSED